LPAPGARLARHLNRSTPTQLDIPRIGLRTWLVPVGLNRDGTIMIPPPTTARGPAGWYKHLASPGEVGPAVIVGHLDSARDGPAVFFRLGTARPGDSISVRRTDRTTATFTVTAVAEFPKSRFPTKSVYGRRDHPALILVTCGGTFDRTVGSYRSNVVVYATLTSTDTVRAGS
jgi:sortase (surface protein transpeptidase)